MNDELVASAVPAEAGPSAGTLLRRAREATGLHVAALAVALKVPVRKLEALEQDRLDELPDAVFCRALAASVCRTLKIDPQPVLDRLPQGAAPRLASSRESINAPFRAPQGARGPSWRGQLARPAVVIAGLLLLGAVAILLWPVVQRESAAVVASASAVLPPTNATRAAAGTASAADAVPTLSLTASAAFAGAGLSAAPAAGSSTQLSQAQAASAAASTTATGASSTAGVPASSVADDAGGGIVAFRASDASWVQVVDARGGVPLQRLLAVGESASISGPLPLVVTVGNVAGTQVRVRGRALDLAPHMLRDNVARFEVR